MKINFVIFICKAKNNKVLLQNNFKFTHTCYIKFGTKHCKFCRIKIRKQDLRKYIHIFLNKPYTRKKICKHIGYWKKTHQFARHMHCRIFVSDFRSLILVYQIDYNSTNDENAIQIKHQCAGVVITTMTTTVQCEMQGNQNSSYTDSRSILEIGLSFIPHCSKVCNGNNLTLSMMCRLTQSYTKIMDITNVTPFSGQHL